MPGGKLRPKAVFPYTSACIAFLDPKPVWGCLEWTKGLSLSADPRDELGGSIVESGADWRDCWFDRIGLFHTLPPPGAWDCICEAEPLKEGYSSVLFHSFSFSSSASHCQGLSCEHLREIERVLLLLTVDSLGVCVHLTAGWIIPRLWLLHERGTDPTWAAPSIWIVY